MLTMIAPKNAIKTASQFVKFIFSFKNNAAKIVIIIVESWLYIAALPAKVCLNPDNQKITDKNVPKNAPIIIVGLVKPLIIVFFKKNESIIKQDVHNVK